MHFARQNDLLQAQTEVIGYCNLGNTQTPGESNASQVLTGKDDLELAEDR